MLRIPKPAPKRDPLLGFQSRMAAVGMLRAFDPPVLNFEGQGFNGVNPPDMVGDVGTRYYIQAINAPDGARYAIYRKSDGALEAGPFLMSDLGGPTGLGDPIVLYDHLADRWLLSEFGADDNLLIVYISRTNDPISGGWFGYQFPTPHFPDYPKYGVWPDAYYVTTNESDGPAIYALDRAEMLDGDPARLQRFLAPELNGFGFQALTPCDLDGPAPPAGSPHYLLRHHDDEVHNVGANDPTQDFLDLYEFRVDWTEPANSTLTGPTGIPISEFDSDLCGLVSFSCFPQQGSSIRLDPLREVIMWRVPYRNFGTHETIVGSFVTDVDGDDHGGVRWFELRKDSTQGWHIHQEGTYAPDGNDRWMSTIAMDGSGNIALGYNVTSVTSFPGLRYVGRLESDPMGTMPIQEQTLIAGAGANTSFRYGDYSALSIDPNDDRLFWFTGQYNPQSRWSTRIGAFRFQDSDDDGPDGDDPDIDGEPEPKEPASLEFSYAAKMICGRQKDPEDRRLAPGFYATSVNIHNPNNQPVTFLKRLALTFPPGRQRPGEVLTITEDTLGPHEALQVDCADLEERLFSGSLPAPYIEGFLIIQSPASLGVTAVYTTAPIDEAGNVQGVSSIHVEPVGERRTRVSRPDLVPVPAP